MKPRYWLLGLGVGLLAVQHLACSSEFTSCEARRNCAPGGASGNGGAVGDPSAGLAGEISDGGTSGESGAAGEAVTPGCLRDADCSDGLACNGTEQCLGGICQAGTAPCANPDADHCDVVCKEAHGAAACSTQGIDSDKDGHRSSECQSNPGDDCDDSNAKIKPGATELCDGVDRDCDGKVDLSDGLPLGGTTVTIGGAGSAHPYPSIAYDRDSTWYVVTYDVPDSSTGSLYLEILDQKGVVVNSPFAVNDASTLDWEGMGLAAGGNAFMAAWTKQGKLYLRATAVSGSLSIPDNYFGTTPALAPAADKSWGLVIDVAQQGQEPRLWGLTLTADGKLGQYFAPITEGPVWGWHIAPVKSKFVVTWSLGQGGHAAAGLFDSQFTLVAPLSLTGREPALGAGAEGFAIAVDGENYGQDRPTFYGFDANGGVTCAPKPFADKDFHPAAIVATPDGYLVASAGALRVQQVFADCSMGALVTVAPGPTSHVGLVGGASGYGLVWQELGTNTSKLRLFGPHYCD